MSKKITFVNGSLRMGSFNQEIINYVQEQLSKKGFEVSQIEISSLPLMSQDIEFPAPAAIDAVREEVKSSDALWIVTPEYNGSVPGGLKNFLDWVSRPVEQGVFGAPEFVQGKLVAISGSAGRSGAALVMEELKGLLTRMAMAPLATTSGIVLPMEAFTTGKLILSDENKAQFDAQIEEFVASLNN